MNQKDNHIFVITTWWTLDKVYWNGIWITDLHIGEPVVDTILRKRAPNQSFSFVSVLKKDSTQITPDDRKEIIWAIQESKSSPVLITHGTDTIIKTGKAIKEALLDTREKLIVLTWASQPHSMRESDAEFNIGFALSLLQSYSQVWKSWVYIAIHGTIFDVENVLKWEDGIFKAIKKELP
jgi:L-asparaginase